MPEDPAARPAISKLSRREFVALTAVAAGGSVLATGWAGARAPDRAAVGGTEAVPLPEQPNLNPAFLARLLPDGDLLLWTTKSKGELLAFRLNRNGRLLWSLCDGGRRPVEIAREYGRVTGRPPAEGEAFLQRLLACGVVAAAAHIVPKGDFPRPPRGGCYHRKLSSEGPGGR
jgi:hypothetical protein